IAYYQYDETHVPVVPLTDYNNLHLAPHLTRYPNPGDPNPLVRIGLVEVPAVLPKTQGAVPPTRWVDLGRDPDVLIVWIQWMSSEALLVHRMPRLQNRVDVLKVHASTGANEVLVTQEDRAWVEAWLASFDRDGNYKLALKFVPGSSDFVWQSEKDGYRHLYLYDSNGKQIRQLTHGEWDVEELVALDGTHRVAFFTAARPSPLERQIFSVLLDGGGEVMQVSDGPGTHQPLFAPDAQHFLDTYSSSDHPPHVRLHRASGRKIADVPNNRGPRVAAQQGDWEFGVFRTSDGVSLNYAMQKPANFDPNREYPVLMYTYGGPGFQIVRDEWGIGGGLEPFCKQKGIISVMVDGRGSGMRGRDFLKVVYQNLGKWEVNDQIEAAKWLGTQPYVDAHRIGIWGGSYGGYMACLCLLRGADVFKMAISMAPVTDWSLYDSVYTERYMRRPKENPQGYETSSPIREVSKLKGVFLLIHGTADDNVHFQNTVRLAAALQKSGKQFQTMFYPGEGHSLFGAGAHLEQLLTQFVTEHLI
ncbi:MAG TPA: prolyl oligopeptidase family serine peptidase, partial [Chthonomonadaceae bacterium]|nr:prolyl oligopeptidase family serine peptidase [Chthonomonadaceae bacterium]